MSSSSVTWKLTDSCCIHTALMRTESEGVLYLCLGAWRVWWITECVCPVPCPMGGQQGVSGFPSVYLSLLWFCVHDSTGWDSVEGLIDSVNVYLASAHSNISRDCRCQERSCSCFHSSACELTKQWLDWKAAGRGFENPGVCPHTVLTRSRCPTPFPGDSPKALRICPEEDKENLSFICFPSPAPAVTSRGF